MRRLPQQRPVHLSLLRADLGIVWGTKKLVKGRAFEQVGSEEYDQRICDDLGNGCFCWRCDGEACASNREDWTDAENEVPAVHWVQEWLDCRVEKILENSKGTNWLSSAANRKEKRFSVAGATGKPAFLLGSQVNWAVAAEHCQPTLLMTENCD